MADNKDRQSRMIASSVNAPAKKDGAGGSYTWGSATDDPTDFVMNQEVIGPNVTTTAYAPASPVKVVQADPFQGNLMDNRQFPTLSGIIMAPPTATGVTIPTMAPGARAWPASSAPKVVLTAEQLRPGTSDMFGSSHPRNTFASKPTPVQTTIVQSAGPQMAIDWSSTGVPLEVNRALIASSNPSHLGLYQTPQAARPVPAQYLRPTTAPVAATRSYRVQAQQKPPIQKHMRAQGSRGQQQR
jgi:hypothetical protein